MKLCTSFALALAYASCSAALENTPRDTAQNCSIGIGRWSGSSLWDITVYNVPQPLRQDVNIISRMTNANMGKGDSITIKDGVPHPITITNMDNAPVFDYDIPEVRANMADPHTGLTKVQLKFEIPDQKLSWTTADCGAGSVVFSAGIESWSCDFACQAASPKEL